MARGIFGVSWATQKSDYVPGLEGAAFILLIKFKDIIAILSKILAILVIISTDLHLNSNLENLIFKRKDIFYMKVSINRTSLSSYILVQTLIRFLVNLDD